MKAAVGLLTFVLAFTPLIAQEKTTVAQLAYLTGTWRGTSTSGNTAEEVVTSSEGGVLLSAGREFRDGRCVFFDLVVFMEKDGVLTLIPHPSGKRSADVFPLTKFDGAAKRATFENRAHDFPKSFTYELTAPDRLRITLTGDVKGQTVSEVYELQRTK